MASGKEEEVVAATFKILVLGDASVGKSSLIKSGCSKSPPDLGVILHTVGA
jgi:GTPase SAR1 family protein